MNLSEIKNRIDSCQKELNQKYPGKSIDIYIAGGSAFTLQGLDERTTRDIDILKNSDPDLRGIDEILKKYEMNTDVSAYFDNFPVGFAKRAKCVTSLDNPVKFHCLSLEDLVISKLCTTRQEKDVTDVEEDFVTTNLDFDLLDELADSMKFSMISSIAYENFRYAYTNYYNQYRGKCKDDDV